MKKHLLAFVMDPDNGQIYVHLDKAGVERLIHELQRIRDGLEKNDCPHFHMFSEEWGDGELSISTALDSKENGTPTHHLKVFGWSDEWVEKHGFKRS